MTRIIATTTLTIPIVTMQVIWIVILQIGMAISIIAMTKTTNINTISRYQYEYHEQRSHHITSDVYNVWCAVEHGKTDDRVLICRATQAVCSLLSCRKCSLVHRPAHCELGVLAPPTSVRLTRLCETDGIANAKKVLSRPRRPMKTTLIGAPAREILTNRMQK